MITTVQLKPTNTEDHDVLVVNDTITSGEVLLSILHEDGNTVSITVSIEHLRLALRRIATK